MSTPETSRPAAHDFRTALESGRFLITTEQTPPKGADLSAWIERVRPLRGHVDAVNVTEASGASVTMSPLGVVPALLGLQLEPVPHVLCRDRNRLALQADLLAAAALGVRAIVATSGDAIEHGDHPDATPVFDLDTLQLLRAAGRLNTGTDMHGNPLRGWPDLLLGAFADPAAEDLDLELRRMEQKAEAGARFFQAQAVYDPAVLERFMNRAQALRVPVLAGFIVVKSGAMGRRLNRSLPGVTVPEQIIRKLDETQDRRAASIEISGRILAQLRPMCSGLQVIAVGWESSLPDILEAAGLKRDAD